MPAAAAVDFQDTARVSVVAVVVRAFLQGRVPLRVVEDVGVRAGSGGAGRPQAAWKDRRESPKL